MKINEKIGIGPLLGKSRQILRIMKLTMLIITVFLLQVSASTKAQITLKETNAPLQKLLKSISLQSGYDFVYSSLDFKNLKPVTIALDNVSVEKALEATFLGQPLIYEISDKTVIVKRKEEKESSIIDKIKGYFATINVRGRVVNENSQPMQGASVSVKNGKGAVNTDVNGFFYLKNVDESSTLVFTYIGFTKKEIAVEGKEDFGDVKMEMSSSKLDEVQIQFSGVTSRRTSTSNIATIKADEIAKQPVDNPLYALMGRVPGLIITPISGLPNAPVKVQIRGQNGLNAESEPLYVVDGVPFINNIETNSVGRFGRDKDGAYPSQISVFSFLNPNDIASIDVLKDADATAIYGSRGANGVILITTKKGRITETNINAGFSSGFSRVSKKIDLMNTQDYLESRRDAFINTRQIVPNQNFPNSLKSSQNFDLTVWDPNRYTDWQDVLLGGTAISNNANANISGGSSTIQYLIGGNYAKLGYVSPGNGKNETGSANFSISGNSPNQKFRTSLNGSYIATSSMVPPDFSYLAIGLSPNAPALYNAGGELNWESNPASALGEATWENPLAGLQRSSQIRSKVLRAALNLSYDINSSLDFQANGGVSQVQNNSFTPSPISSQDPATFSYARAAANYNDAISSTWSIEPQLSYIKNLGGGKLNLLVGGSWQGQNTENEWFNVNGIVNDALIHSISAGTINNQRNTSSEYKYIGAFGRLNYNYKDKYIANLNFRRDGSSRFGFGNQFGNFGSIGMAWVFSNESFLDKRNEILSFGKIRSSFGTSGNDAIGDYQYVELFDSDSQTQYQNSFILTPQGAVNPDYHWENKRSWELGLDLGFFKDKLLLSTSYFYALSTNQLINFPLPLTAGTPAGIKINQNATLRNSGLEANVSSQIIKRKNFNWTLSGNISFLNRNKILALPGGNYAISRLSILYPQGVDPVGKSFAGVVAAAKFTGVDPLTGVYTFADKDGKPTSNVSLADRFAETININPKYYGGISNQVTFQNFSFSFFIQFTKQLGKSYIFQKSWGTGPGLSISSNQPAVYANRWRASGDISSIQKISTAYPVFQNLELMTNSDASWVDASFLRLKNVAVSYQVSDRIKKKLGVKNLSLNLNAQNILTVTGYGGFDPETQSVGSLPPLRNITTGIQIGF